MSQIYIQPLVSDNSFWINDLVRAVSSQFSQSVRVTAPAINLSKAFDNSRHQYSSTALLVQLLDAIPPDCSKLLCIVNVDLFIPILTFVFGEAQLGGTVSIMSTHRLNNIFYGLPEDSELLRNRIIKEAIHELGHTFGLIHCSDQNCVMKSSTYVEGVDQKGAELCAHCRGAVH